MKGRTLYYFPLQRTEGHAGAHRGWPSHRGQQAAAARADSGWNWSGVGIRRFPVHWLIWKFWSTQTVPSWLAPDPRPSELLQRGPEYESPTQEMAEVGPDQLLKEGK